MNNPANALVLASYALFAAAGFLVHPVAGLVVVGVECLTLGVALARNDRRDEL